jgi:hypothetical protein
MHPYITYQLASSSPSKNKSYLVLMHDAPFIPASKKEKRKGKIKMHPSSIGCLVLAPDKTADNGMDIIVVHPPFIYFAQGDRALLAPARSSTGL